MGVKGSPQWREDLMCPLRFRSGGLDSAHGPGKVQQRCASGTVTSARRPSARLQSSFPPDNEIMQAVACVPQKEFAFTARSIQIESSRLHGGLSL